MIVCFSARERGFSHLADGKPCQDSVIDCELSQDGCCVIACADGHGSEKHFRSDVGSLRAVQLIASKSSVFTSFWMQANEKLRENNLDDKFFKTNLSQIEGVVIDRWRKAVNGHFAKQPLSEKEFEICKKENFNLDMDDKENDIPIIYGTTLLAVLVTPRYWCAIQLGDGAVTMLDAEGKPRILTELQDESLGFGRTTSLCASDALDHFKHVYHVYEPNEKRIAGITCATDGVVDSFIPEKYLEFNLKLQSEFLQNKDAAQKSLEAFLPKLSEQGSKDDAGIAGVFYREGINAG